MKKTISLFITVICILTFFTGTAMAAPTAMSYFTDSSYNKTYMGDDGLSHTMTVTWVGETWNKAGTVIYSINYDDVYENGDNFYIDVKSATEIYENASLTYPDSTEYIVYQVKWYPDGDSEVISDNRTAATSEPTAEPAKIPTTSPSDETTTIASSTIATTEEPETTPNEEATYDPAYTQTMLSEANSPTPNSTSDVSVGSTLSPSPEDTQIVAVHTDTQNQNKSWWGLLIFFVGICIVIITGISIKRRKERNRHEKS